MKQILNFFDSIFISLKNTGVGVSKAIVFIAWLTSTYIWLLVLFFFGVFYNGIEKKISFPIAIILFFCFIILFAIRYLRKKSIEQEILNFEVTKEQKRRFNITLIILGLILFILFLMFLSKYVFFRSYFVI